MLVLAIIFQMAPAQAGLQVMGLVCAIFGLMAFLEGLRVCIMVRVNGRGAAGCCGVAVGCGVCASAPAACVQPQCTCIGVVCWSRHHTAFWACMQPDLDPCRPGPLAALVPMATPLPLLQPFAEVLGQELPAKVHVVFVLAIAFCLGVLVTYAEPAISALRPLAALVSRCFSSRILLQPPASCSQPPQQPPPRALPTAVCGSVQAQLTVWVPDNTAPRITFRRHCLPACLPAGGPL